MREENGMNPEKALDAMLEDETAVNEDTVFPLTVARYAYLEKIDSPLLTGKPDVDATMATAFVMTCPRQALKRLHTREEIFEAAVDWADERPLSALADIVAAVVQSLQTINYIAPEVDDSKAKKKLQTDS